MVLDGARPDDRSTQEAAVGAGGVAALGAVTGLGAPAASSCCVLPIVPGSLVAGAVPVLGVLAPLRTPPVLVGVLPAVVGWHFHARRRQAARRPSGSRPAPRRPSVTSVVPGLATLLIAAVDPGRIEPAISGMLRAARCD